MFYVYVDLTHDLVPFYVGKGTSKRVSFSRRNEKHRDVSANLGIIRLVVFESEDESAAFEKEKELIIDCQTHAHRINEHDNELACNLTAGGQGSSGRPSTMKGRRFDASFGERVSAALRGKKKKAPPWNKGRKGAQQGWNKGLKQPETSLRLKGKTSPVKGRRLANTQKFIDDIYSVVDRLRSGELRKNIAIEYGISTSSVFKIMKTLQVTI